MNHMTKQEIIARDTKILTAACRAMVDNRFPAYSTEMHPSVVSINYELVQHLSLSGVIGCYLRGKPDLECALDSISEFITVAFPPSYY